jgi:hypothetical protein
MAATREVQMPAADGTLQGMTWLGYTIMHDERCVEYLQSGSSVPCGPWRHGGNDNPTNMLEVARSILPQYKIAFLVQRDLNRNVVLYTVNQLSPGVADPARPLSAFWLMIPGEACKSKCAEEEKEMEVDLGEVYTEDLNTLERTLAYGVSASEVVDKGHVRASVRAVSGEGIDVVYDAEEQEWNAYVVMNGQRVKLQQFFIYTEPRQWSPWPKTVELHIHVSTRVPGGAELDVVYHFEV